MGDRIPLIYALSSGTLYGLQEMAFATASGLSDEFEPVFFTPPGPVVEEARKLGFKVIETLFLRSDEAGGITSAQCWDFSAQLRPYLSRHKTVVFFGTRSMHNVVFAVLNLFYQRRAVNIHIVHGVEAEARFGRKRILNRFPFPLIIVGVSEFVRERLLAHGVRRQIFVIENYLPAQRLAATPLREPFQRSGIHRAAVISRLHAVKRIDVLLSCLENRRELNSIAFHIYGDGPEGDALRSRVAKSDLNVIFEGFRSDVAEQLTRADVLVHLCPSEAFGLVFLEAMAAGVPIIAPDVGASAFIIKDGVNGLHFAANDAESLGACLDRLRDAEPKQLNALVAEGRAALLTRFSERYRLADYRSLIWANLGPNSAPDRTGANVNPDQQ